ncbi:hypothetical protein BDP27DRAFT_1433801 [Rhodocollybia butyracea]|uniref:F-box domain-containing protein n=1 Tax=Rhodocollybia butyracea TaxID=206335 RepID=A0A9P5TX93_9AGAR|nr:hypothetical protein BDP27DRAFT_1433801 [Rhodocollybia butyracea]
MSAPPIAVELAELVIDHLSDDPKTLATCSLVCSTWIARTRHLMFETVHLNPRRSKTFIRLLSCVYSTILPHIHRLDIDCQATRVLSDEESTLSFDRFLLALNKINVLHDIRILCLQDVDWTTYPLDVQSSIAATFHGVFPSVTHLQLNQVVLHDIRQLNRVLRSLPELERLEASLKFLKYPEYAMGHPGEESRLPRNLKDIELGDEGMAVVLGCLGAQSFAGSIGSLSLKGCPMEMFPRVSGALHALSTTLKTLHISFLPEYGHHQGPTLPLQETREPFYLPGQIPLLASGGIDLAIGSKTRDEKLRAILDLLAGISCSTSINFISLNFRIRSLACFDWNALFNFFSIRKKLGSKQRVKISLDLESGYTSFTTTMITEWAKANMGLLDSKAHSGVTILVTKSSA